MRISDFALFAAPSFHLPSSCLATRFCGDASVHDMPVTLLRNHSTPNNAAHHRTLRHAVASTSAKMPRRWKDGAAINAKSEIVTHIVHIARSLS